MNKGIAKVVKADVVKADIVKVERADYQTDETQELLLRANLRLEDLNLIALGFLADRAKGFHEQQVILDMMARKNGINLV